MPREYRTEDAFRGLHSETLRQHRSDFPQTILRGCQNLDDPFRIGRELV